MRKLPILLISLFLTAGCLSSEESNAAPPEALFCDVEEKRQFSKEEIDWRSRNAPWNLARDYRTNLTWERECPEIPET